VDGRSQHRVSRRIRRTFAHPSVAGPSRTKTLVECSTTSVATSSAPATHGLASGPCPRRRRERGTPKGVRTSSSGRISSNEEMLQHESRAPYGGGPRPASTLGDAGCPRRRTPAAKTGRRQAAHRCGIQASGNRRRPRDECRPRRGAARRRASFTAAFRRAVVRGTMPPPAPRLRFTPRSRTRSRTRQAAWAGLCASRPPRAENNRRSTRAVLAIGAVQWGPCRSVASCAHDTSASRTAQAPTESKLDNRRCAARRARIAVFLTHISNA